MVIGESLAARLRLLAQSVQLGRRVESVIGPTCLDQTIGIFGVCLATLALTIRSVGASDTDAFVDLDSAPLQGFDDVILGPRNETLRIGILDAQNHLAPVTAGEQIVIKRRAHSSHVEGSRGTRSETHANLLRHNITSFILV